MRRALLRAAAARATCALIACALAAPAASHAQVAVSNLLVAQAGHSKLYQPSNRTDLYDQFEVQATIGELRIGGRYETDENSEQAYTYKVITQRWAEWTDRGLRVRVGNIYTILGRGLIQRSFEVPGVVLDEPGLLSRYGFSRDLDGVLVEGEAGPFSTRIFTGKPNGGTISPGTEAVEQPRYLGEVAGGQAALAPWRGSRVGAAYLRYTDPLALRQDELGSSFAEIDPLRALGVKNVALPLYAEYAGLNRKWDQWWELKTGDKVPHALYVGSNLLWGPVSVSGEWKDYRNFRLGYNDPPSLVREQSFTLLNRATHVLDAESEHGFQAEASYTVPAWGSVTANHSRSDGTPANRARRYEATYWELYAAPTRWPSVEGTAYIQRGLDEFDFVTNDDIYGGSVTVRARRDWSATMDLARKDETRRPAVSSSDHYFSCGIARAQWGSATLVWERTSDPRTEDPVRDVDPHVDPVTFVSGVVSARLTERHQATLTVGKRRGGLACTAGTCYTVEPFSGAELRLTTRF